jgi:hypothetical protein
MLRERRRGQPPRALRATWAKVTARVRRLVDDVHDGNLLEASAHAQVPYATLREIHSGRAKQPGVAILEQLARAYRLPLDWFFDGSATDDGTIPLAGWVGFLPDPKSVDNDGRRIAIPYAAWPLIRVLVQLEQRLRDRPAHPDRPIIGSATDPREIRRRITTFVFQPLLAAESLVAKASRGSQPEAGPPEPSVALLRDLGRFWERALGPLVPGLAPAGRFGEVA